MNQQARTHSPGVPALLLVAVGGFSLFAGPEAVSSIVERLSGVIPREAVNLVQDALLRVTEQQAGAGVTMAVVGFVLAPLWSLAGVRLAAPSCQAEEALAKRLSAKALAHCWEAADGFPPPAQALFDNARLPRPLTRTSIYLAHARSRAPGSTA